MSTTAQLLRGSSANTGGGSFEALNRILADLCIRGNHKDGALLALKKHLEEEARDLSGEAFSRFMDQLYERISSLLERNDVAEDLGASRVIDELTGVAHGENGSKVSKFSQYIRTVLESKRDPEILVLASWVLGHLARAGGAVTADEVGRQEMTAEGEGKRSNLRNEGRQGNRRFRRLPLSPTTEKKEEKSSREEEEASSNV